jgi:hypothetical protein
MVLEGSRFKYENMGRVGCKLKGCAYVNVLPRPNAGEPGLIEAFEYHTQLQFVTGKAGLASRRPRGLIITTVLPAPAGTGPKGVFTLSPSTRAVNSLNSLKNRAALASAAPAGPSASKRDSCFRRHDDAIWCD